MRWGLIAAVVAIVAVAYLLVALLRTPPAASVVPASFPANFRDGPPALAWPSGGQAAVGVQGVGVIGLRRSASPTPIASVAKVMTAFVVLSEHPLRAGAGGPTITVNRADVGVYRADLAAGQSVVTVRAGERLTERQALEGLLLPSGNNIATLLANWDAGSTARFVAKMNTQAQALGLRRTFYADPSGLSASTVSTAGDQLRVAMQAFWIPAFAQIVGMSQVTLPVAGRQYNLNGLLGRDGIVGIKTGSTSHAGGCFVFAARQPAGGRTITVVGAVLHQMPSAAQPSIIAAAFSASTALLGSVPQVLVTRRVVHRHATVGWLETPWASPDAIVATRSASLLGWPGLPIHVTIASAPDVGGHGVGTAILAAGHEHTTVGLVAARPLPGPSIGWRLTHPLP